ncbi:MAG: transposase, partial [Raoultibacter sp.]
LHLLPIRSHWRKGVGKMNAVSTIESLDAIDTTSFLDVTTSLEKLLEPVVGTQDTPARQSYPDSLKLEAVLAVLEGGMSKREVVETFEIASLSTLKKWLTAYRKNGKQALVAKKRGRPVGRPAVRSSAFDPLNYQASYYLHAENARLVSKLGSK